MRVRLIGNGASGIVNRSEARNWHIGDSVRRLPRDGARFERSEDRAYDRAYQAGGNCERLYSTCRHSIYDVDFWSCDPSRCYHPAERKSDRKLTANFFWQPARFAAIFLPDVSAALVRSFCGLIKLIGLLSALSSLRTFQTPIERDLVVLYWKARDSAVWEINLCHVSSIKFEFVYLSFKK